MDRDYYVVLQNPTDWDFQVKFVLEKEIDRGDFYITYLATKKSNKKLYTCKRFLKEEMKSQLDYEEVRREVKVLSQLPGHRHILALKDTYEDADSIYIVMEHCDGGYLFDQILANNKRYSERVAAQVIHAIVEVILTCHDRGIMLRDVNPENFLFANKEKTAPLKAVDFGQSVFFKTDEKFEEIVGSPYYIAPEVLNGEYGPKADIWSAGVILYILLHGAPPFLAETEGGVLQAILERDVDLDTGNWVYVSDGAKALVKKMLCRVCDDRPSPRAVLDDPWLRKPEKASSIYLGDPVRSRLKDFSMRSKLKKCALKVIARDLCQGDAVAVDKAFQITFTNDEAMSELRNALESLGHQVTVKDCKLLTGFDCKDLYQKYKEFVKISIHLKQFDSDANLGTAFVILRKSPTADYIEIGKLRDALDDPTVADAKSEEEMLMQDRRISFEEFVTMMKAGTNWRKASSQFSRSLYKELMGRASADEKLPTWVWQWVCLKK